MLHPDVPRKPDLFRLGAALMCLIPFVLFLKLGHEVLERTPIGIDIATLEWIHQFANPTLDHTVKFLTLFGGVEVIIAITVVVSIILARKERWRSLSILLIGVGGAAILNLFLKTSFQRIRPSLWTPIVQETSFSFPSGHAMMSSALAFSLILVLWRTRYRWLAVAMGLAYIAVIGLTRLYLGVHYPTDVIGGWAVSYIWLTIVAIILAQSSKAWIWPWSKPK